jgi:2Fe-2S ferredoxin
MIQIHVAENGQSKRIIGQPGDTLMETLRAAGIEGIVAECGGAMACASCHVMLDRDWLTRTGEVSDMEDDMLDCTAAEREAGSRLACQIKLTNDLDGLSLRVPGEQL